MAAFRYRILRAEGYGPLEKQVADSIVMGWTPIGGVSVCPNSFSYKLGMNGVGEITSFCVAQAMIQRDPE